MSKTEQQADEIKRAFRATLGKFATGVIVATARNEDSDEDVGMTMSSFNSVSMDPPLVLFSIAKSAYSCTMFEQAKAFGISVLGEGQEELAMTFARALEDKWSGITPERGEEGVALMPQAVATFECKPYAQYDGGDHVIFVVEVSRHESDASGAKPLLFFEGKFQQVA